MNKKFSITSHELFPEIKLIENFVAGDNRGSFTKIYNDEIYASLGIETEIREIFYSASQKNVIRGMHFQREPYSQNKLIHVISGAVKDVILDIRKDSDTFGQAIEIYLCSEDSKSIYIPAGFAHGFCVLEDNTTMIYNVSKGYCKEADTGILWNSIPYDWSIEQPILSERDNSFVTLEEFKKLNE